MSDAKDNAARKSSRPRERSGVVVDQHRTHIRLRIDPQAEMSTFSRQIDPYGETTFSLLCARTVDVSDNGLALRTNVALDPGDRVMVELCVDDHQPGQERMGQVVWSARFASLPGENVVGVELLPLGPDQEAAVWRSLCRLATAGAGMFTARATLPTWLSP